VNLHCEIEDATSTEPRGKRRWVKKWIRRRNLNGASNTFLKELAEENPSDYRTHLRMSPEKSDKLLAMIEPPLFTRKILQ
jgi:hypothetical protein